MAKLLKTLSVSLAPAFILLFSTNALATPSTTLWIPSVDIQAYGVWHFGVDTYTTVGKKAEDGGRMFPVDYGLTVGVAPFETWGVEIGVDMFEQADDPIYLNAKAALYEGALGDWSPALAVGGYTFGTKSEVTDYNIIYVVAAKSFDSIGRITVGFYSGNDKLLVDKDGEKDASGLLASWDLQLTDKWWLAVDYMGGKNAFGATSFGFAYAAADNVGILFGYNIFADNDIGGEGANSNTLEFNLDVNF